MRFTWILLLCLCCNGTLPSEKQTNSENQDILLMDTAGKTIMERFSPPSGFYRFDTGKYSFGYWLCRLTLKHYSHAVRYYNGDIKPNDQTVYCSVIDMDAGNRDLQQCADAVMRLRAEYLYSLNRYAEIGFIFTGDGKMHTYDEYSRGDRSYFRFRKYLDYIFAYANTSSLHKQLKVRSFENLSPGDVLIQTGNPYGHAVMVVDVCMNSAGQKIYMLAQSYMPAQEIQILINPENGSPWYDFIPGQYVIRTPEWEFKQSDLKTW